MFQTLHRDILNLKNYLLLIWNSPSSIFYLATLDEVENWVLAQANCRSLFGYWPCPWLLLFSKWSEMQLSGSRWMDETGERKKIGRMFVILVRAAVTWVYMHVKIILTAGPGWETQGHQWSFSMGVPSCTPQQPASGLVMAGGPTAPWITAFQVGWLWLWLGFLLECLSCHLGRTTWVRLKNLPFFSSSPPEGPRFFQHLPAFNHYFHRGFGLWVYHICPARWHAKCRYILINFLSKEVRSMEGKRS